MNLVLCKCGKHYPAARQARIEKSDGVFSVGVQCPHCGEFTHSFYDDSNLVELRESADKLGKKKHRSKKHRRAHDAMLERFARAFDALQERLK